MLGISPLSVTYSFAKIKENESRKFDSSKSIQYERFIVIFTEKAVNGKLEVQYQPIPEDVSKEGGLLRLFLLKIQCIIG